MRFFIEKFCRFGLGLKEVDVRLDVGGRLSLIERGGRHRVRSGGWVWEISYWVLELLVFFFILIILDLAELIVC